MNNDELQRLKDEKYHLLKLINHDIRSPFNRLYALLQLFEFDSKNLTEQQVEYMDSMYLSILSGLEMIQNLRDMREIDAGNVEISYNEIQLRDIIQQALRSFSKQIELKKLKLNLEMESADIKLNTDEYYLQRIIENVLSNAIKFSKEGKEILIRARGENDNIRIEIRDFGEGIKPSEEKFLFEKFKKLSSFATGGEGSLGLGLYNAMLIIKMIKGDIKLNRDVQMGSSFIISIPKNN